jgi:hypothetical protein
MPVNTKKYRSEYGVASATDVLQALRTNHPLKTMSFLPNEDFK